MPNTQGLAELGELRAGTDAAPVRAKGKAKAKALGDGKFQLKRG